MTAEMKNPATCFMHWEGSTGRFKWWNKDTASDVYVDAPFTFVVLDELLTVKGWSDKHNSGIWSNEVRNILEPLTVQTKECIIAQGKYLDIKGKVSGLRYCQSVYVAFKSNNGELVLGNFQLKGSALSAWIDFVGKQKLVGKAVSFTRTIKSKKGANEFFVPVFEQRSLTEETVSRARQIYKNLQEYLRYYFSSQNVKELAT